MAELEKLIEGLLEDPDTVGKLKSLLGGEQKSEDPPSALPAAIDPAMMLKLTKAMSAMNELSDDEGARLLCDLRPYISGSRRKRVDEAVQILKLLRVMNLFKDDFGKEF